jgi:hypothetical protein
MSVVDFPFEKVNTKTMASTLRYFANLIDNGENPSFVFAATLDKINIVSMSSGIGIYEIGLVTALQNQVLNCKNLSQDDDDEVTEMDD